MVRVVSSSFSLVSSFLIYVQWRKEKSLSAIVFICPLQPPRAVVWPFSNARFLPLKSMNLCLNFKFNEEMSMRFYLNDNDHYLIQCLHVHMNTNFEIKNVSMIYHLKYVIYQNDIIPTMIMSYKILQSLYSI